MWSYDKKSRADRLGGRWYFVTHYTSEEEGESGPYILYFRNEERTEFGLIEFKDPKNMPYRDYDALITKIMNNAPFRRSLLDAETEGVWKKNWK